MTISRVAARRQAVSQSMKRSCSAPTLLAPVWEPEEECEQPAYLNTAGSLDIPDRPSPRSVCDSEDEWVPAEWVAVLGALADADRALTSTQQLSGYELFVTAQASLRYGPGVLRLGTGIVEHSYELKRQLVSGRGFRVMEGVEKTTLKNFCLKVIPGSSAPRWAKRLEPMQAFHLISSFVEEVCRRLLDAKAAPRACVRLWVCC